MRIRSAFAIALLATGLGAPTLAAQLPARELEFVGYPDPYSGYYGEGGMGGVATRFVSRAGWIYVVGGYGGGLAGYLTDPSSFTVVTDYQVSEYECFNSNECHLARAINQAGRIVGGEYFYAPGCGGVCDYTKPYEVSFDPQADEYPILHYLTSPPGFSMGIGVHVVPTAINDSDLIAGWARRDIFSPQPQVPIWWPSPSAPATELPRVSTPNVGPFPTRINAAGVIVGNTIASAPMRAAVWRPTYTHPWYTLAFLGELPGGTSSRAYDIGFFGGIVGSSDDGSGTDVAVIWRLTSVGYTVTPLPVPPGGSCFAATAINTNGDIAGNCTRSDGAERGVVWRKLGGTYELLHELEPLPEHTRSVAWALDDDGQAGGGSGPQYAERAVLWPVVVAAPVSVPALSHGALLCLIAALAGASVARLRAHH